MSTYNGRHGPNVSAYLRDLNTISPRDTTAAAAEDGFNMEDDLALFTNTQFFDFDSGQNTDFQAQPVKIDVETAARQNSTASGDVTPSQTTIGDIPSLDFMSSEFLFLPAPILQLPCCFPSLFPRFMRGANTQSVHKILSLRLPGNL